MLSLPLSPLPSVHSKYLYYGVVEWVKITTLKLFGHIEREKSEEFVKKVYASEIECPKHFIMFVCKNIYKLMVGTILKRQTVPF